MLITFAPLVDDGDSLADDPVADDSVADAPVADDSVADDPVAEVIESVAVAGMPVYVVVVKSQNLIISYTSSHASATIIKGEDYMSKSQFLIPLSWGSESSLTSL